MEDSLTVGAGEGWVGQVALLPLLGLVDPVAGMLGRVVLDNAGTAVLLDIKAAHIADGSPLIDIALNQPPRIAASGKIGKKPILLSKGDPSPNLLLPDAGPAILGISFSALEPKASPLPAEMGYSLMLICDLIDARLGLTASMHAHYRLTDAEAEILGGLLEGLEVDTIATARGTSSHTIRNQIKQLLSRTHCRSRYELLHRALSAAFLLSHR